MIEFIKLKPTVTLDDYASWSYLAGAIHDLRQEAERFSGRFKGRSVLMLNSTAHGGGVAEMMPQLVLMLNELGLTTHWVVMKTERAEFFQFTKRLHNLIHGEGEPVLTRENRELYEAVNRTIADELRPHLKPGDVLVVHDPQPLAAGAMLRQELDIHAIWRCHIGLDVDLPATRAAWSFLRCYAEAYDHSMFSAPEYIPDYLAGRASVTYPGIDPLSPKNRYLSSADMLAGILCNAGLVKEHAPVLTPPFQHQAQRLQSDGHFGPATAPDEIGFLFRPIVAEISRWDRLKGFGPLMEGFVRLKQKLREPTTLLNLHQRRRLEIVRLVLAGPDPNSIQDDPEARKELEGLCHAYCELAPEFQKDIVLLSLPMASPEQNALMVGAIQRCSTVVVQNSLHEGFGLTVTEAMWKVIPVLGTEACGIRHQIRDGIEGRLVHNPQDPEEIADQLEAMLVNDSERARFSRNGHTRVYTEFLAFIQLQRALRALADVLLPVQQDHYVSHAESALAGA